MALSDSVSLTFAALSQQGDVALKELQQAIAFLKAGPFSDGPDDQAVDQATFEAQLLSACEAAQKAGMPEGEVLAALAQARGQGQAPGGQDQQAGVEPMGDGLAAEAGGPEASGEGEAQGEEGALAVAEEGGEEATLATSAEVLEGGAELLVVEAAGEVAEEASVAVVEEEGDGGELEAAAEEVEGVKKGPVYVHPEDGRPYLESEVIPLVREGILALVSELEKQKLALAAGDQWLPGGFLPYDWKPFSPYRWLAAWLLEHRPEPPSPPEPTYTSLSRDAKAALFFDAALPEPPLDPSMAALTFPLLCDKLRVLEQRLTQADVARVLGSLDPAWALEGQEVEEGGYAAMAVSKEAVQGLVGALADQLDPQADAEYRLDGLVHASVGQELIGHCFTMEDKFRFIYLTLDGSESSYQQALPGDQVLQLLSRGLGMPEDEAMLALAAAGKEPSDVLTCADVVALLSRCFPSTPPSNGVMSRLVSQAVAISRGLPSDLVSAMVNAKNDPLDEVELPEFADYIRGLPTYGEVPMASTSEVQDYSFTQRTALLQLSDPVDAAPPPARPSVLRKEASVLHSPRFQQPAQILLLDVRSQEEVDVSAIPGAMHAPAEANPSAVHGWSLARASDLASLKQRLELAVIRSQPIRLILYCNGGLRSGAVAAELRAKLKGCEAMALCGGILNYFNLGGQVKAPSGGVVQAVHPGEQDMRAYITRPNKYKK